MTKEQIYRDDQNCPVEKVEEADKYHHERVDEYAKAHKSASASTRITTTTTPEELTEELDEEFHSFFPYRLHCILTAADSEQQWWGEQQLQQQWTQPHEGGGRLLLSNIISWMPCGTIFKVHDPVMFERNILPKMGRLSRFKSFLRQLNLYRFKRIRSIEGAAYAHPYFLRNHVDLCRGVLRGEEINKSTSTSSSSPSSPSPSRLKFTTQQNTKRKGREQEDSRLNKKPKVKKESLHQVASPVVVSSGFKNTNEQNKSSSTSTGISTTSTRTMPSAPSFLSSSITPFSCPRFEMKERKKSAAVVPQQSHDFLFTIGTNGDSKRSDLAYGNQDEDYCSISNRRGVITPPFQSDFTLLSKATDSFVSGDKGDNDYYENGLIATMTTQKQQQQQQQQQQEYQKFQASSSWIEVSSSATSSAAGEEDKTSGSMDPLNPDITIVPKQINQTFYGTPAGASSSSIENDYNELFSSSQNHLLINNVSSMPDDFWVSDTASASTSSTSSASPGVAIIQQRNLQFEQEDQYERFHRIISSNNSRSNDTSSSDKHKERVLLGDENNNQDPLLCLLDSSSIHDDRNIRSNYSSGFTMSHHTFAFHQRQSQDQQQPTEQQYDSCCCTNMNNHEEDEKGSVEQGEHNFKNFLLNNTHSIHQSKQQRRHHLLLLKNPERMDIQNEIISTFLNGTTTNASFTTISMTNHYNYA